MRTSALALSIPLGVLTLLAARPAAADGFLPHAVCYLWDPALLSLHAISDGLIGLSYVAISATLGYLVYRARRQLPFHSMILAFGGFIVACGATHFMGLWTLWHPAYWLAGGVKVVTAIASVATALLLPPLVPKALRLAQGARVAADQAQAVRASETRFRALLESAPDGIVIASPEGRIVLVNEQAEMLFGYRRDEMIGQRVEILLPERLRTAHVEHRANYHADPRTRPMGVGLDLLARRKDGSEFPAEISLSPLETDEGPLVTTVIRDITERKRAEAQRLELMRAQAARAAAEAARHDADAARRLAESASRMKDEFLATVSHELRTPLTSILGWARMLRTMNLDLPASAQRPIETIERNAKVQAQLIEDLLDVSRIVSGRVRIEDRPVNLAEVVDAAVEVVRPAADAKHLSLSVDLTTAITIGDANRLQQIVWNLLSNAVKFTDPGGRVTVSLTERDDHVVLTVADTGRGISKEFLPFLFERFRQAETGTTRRFGGLGLGLAIVRHLVEMHGGAVRADSPGEGHGATFTVELPAVPQSRRAAQRGEGSDGRLPIMPKTSREPAPVSLHGSRVLVVEDDEDARVMLASILVEAGAEVLTAPSAAVAFEMLGGQDIDVLIADIGMPDEDGYSLMRRIRRSPDSRVARIAAVAVTAYARAEDRELALAAGFQSHLAKPVEPAVLVSEVAGLVRRGRAA